MSACLILDSPSFISNFVTLLYEFYDLKNYFGILTVVDRHVKQSQNSVPPFTMFTWFKVYEFRLHCDLLLVLIF